MKWGAIREKDRKMLLNGFGELGLRTRGVFLHAGPDPRWRFIPKAFGPETTAWQTWDRKEQKFLSDDELIAVPIEAVFDEEFLS